MFNSHMVGVKAHTLAGFHIFLGMFLRGDMIFLRSLHPTNGVGMYRTLTYLPM